MRVAGGLAIELREAPDVICRQAQALAGPLATLLARLRRYPPDVVMTCARGSSAHAAAFAKHLIERYCGIPVAASAPSVTTIYRRRLRLKGQFFLGVSQSGISDDLVEAATMARTAGALTAALVNDPDSPLASACEFVLPMAAGSEHSIAATKTFVASLAALMRMAALWASDEKMHRSCERLPERVGHAAELDWSAALSPLGGASSLMTLGRGPTFAVAREAALKLKEACTLHAEAFSSAEFRHGPIALASEACPILMFQPNDAAGADMLALAADLGRKGVRIFVAGSPPDHKSEASYLPVLPPEHAEADAICLIQTFYAFLVQLAERRGKDIESPPHLQKVTRTR